MIRSLALSLLALSFIAISCNQGGSGEAYTLKMRLAKGDTFTQELDMDMDMDMNAMGQNMKMKMGMKSAVDFEVSGDSANLKNLSMTYRKQDMTMSMGGMPGTEGLNYDSIANKIANHIVGKKVVMQLDRNNEIVNVTGFEEVMASDSSLTPEMEDQMTKMFSKEQLNNLFSMMFQVYPDKPVRVGDSWNKELKTSMSNVSLTIDMKYKLTSVKDGIAYIDAKGKIKTKGTMKSGPMDIEMDMNGTQEGQINIGVDDGYLRDGQFTMAVDAEMGVQNIKMPMKMKANYLMRGKK
jgi:hypothetical protein